MMLPFWLAASLMVAAALAIVLPPLLRPSPPATRTRRRAVVETFRAQRDELDRDLAAGEIDERSHREALGELERRLLDECGDEDTARAAPATPQTLLATTVALLLPLLAFGTYFSIGTPDALAPEPAPAPDARIPHPVHEMLEGLRARLQRQPDDAEGWLTLGRSYARMNRLAEARDALARAAALRPAHAFTLVAYAEVLAGLGGNRLEGESLALIERALAADPAFPRALWLAGVAYHNAGDNPRALALWRRLQGQPLEPDAARAVTRAIALAGGGDPQPVAAEASITVTVRLAPDLAARVASDDTLFVFARAAEGPRMPLAVARHRAGELPLTVTLDDSHAMTPQMRLSAYPQVLVGARVSRSGSATPGSGDLEGDAGLVAVAPGARAEVVIAGIVP